MTRCTDYYNFIFGFNIISACGAFAAFHRNIKVTLLLLRQAGGGSTAPLHQDKVVLVSK